MTQEIRFSALPDGVEFKDNRTGFIYTKSSCGRGKRLVDNQMVYTRFKKHYIITWLNAYEE
jgi:hypothetical protein